MHGQHFDTAISPAVALDCAVRVSRAIRKPLETQLSTASHEPLDDARQRRYCRILFDGCEPQPPSHRPMWSNTNRRPQVTVRFSLDSPPGRRLARRHVRGSRDRSDCASASGQAPDPFSGTSIRIVTLPRPHRLSVVDASEPHSVLPIHSRTSTRNRHRRSTWAGVSWPNDDGIGASGGDNIGRTLARTRTTRSTRSVTSICAPSSERLPVRLRASCSRRNGKRHSAEIH